MSQGSNLLSSVNEVPMLYKRLFGKELDFFDMLELLKLILRKTGGMATNAYLLKKGVIKDFKLVLPCRVAGIKHVCDSRPMSWYDAYIIRKSDDHLINYRVDQSGNMGINNPDATNYDQISESTLNIYEVNKNVFTAPLGRMIAFENDNNTDLHFNQKTGEVDVLYVNPVFDENGYPKVPEKVLEAIAYYMFYIDVRQRYHQGLATGDQSRSAKDEMNEAIQAARNPDFLSQNEIDDLLNVLTSFNRKRHNLQHRK